MVLGYGMLYTMYQKTWGQGGSFLYWITGSTRFPGPATAGKDTSGGVQTTPPAVTAAQKSPHHNSP